MIVHLSKFNTVDNFFYSFKSKFFVISNYSDCFDGLCYFSVNNDSSKNFLSKFYRSFSSKKIRKQKGTGKSRVSTKSSSLFVGSGYCFGFRENKYMHYKKLINKFISNFFNIIIINNRCMFNFVDFFYLSTIFSITYYIDFSINNNCFSYLYYLLYASNVRNNFLYYFNFKNNYNSLLLLFKKNNFTDILLV